MSRIDRSASSSARTPTNVAQGHLRRGEAARSESEPNRSPRVLVREDARVLAVNESPWEERSVLPVREHRSDDASEASPQMTCATGATTSQA